MKIKQSRWVILLTIVFIIVGPIIYFYNFHGPISVESSKWNDFSSFLNPFIALGNLVIISWLSFQVYHYNKEKDFKDGVFQRTIERPTLVFKVEIGVHGEGEYWKVINIGKGAAINLKIGESSFRNSNWNSPIAQCYSLGNSESHNLEWLKSANILCVVYHDVFENMYVTIMADNELYIRAVDDKFINIKVKGHNFSKSDIDAFLSLPSIGLAEMRDNHTTGKYPTTTLQTTSQNG